MQAGDKRDCEGPFTSHLGGSTCHCAFFSSIICHQLVMVIVCFIICFFINSGIGDPASRFKVGSAGVMGAAVRYDSGQYGPHGAAVGLNLNNLLNRLYVTGYCATQGCVRSGSVHDLPLLTGQKRFCPLKREELCRKNTQTQAPHLA